LLIKVEESYLYFFCNSEDFKIHAHCILYSNLSYKKQNILKPFKPITKWVKQT